MRQKENQERKMMRTNHGVSETLLFAGRVCCPIGYPLNGSDTKKAAPISPIAQSAINIAPEVETLLNRDMWISATENPNKRIPVNKKVVICVHP